MRLPEWLAESHRFYHLVGIFVVSLFGTILMGIGCICGMEFKDVHHSYGNDGKPFRQWNWSAWDWIDVAAGAIGAVLAVVVHLIVFLLVR